MGGKDIKSLTKLITELNKKKFQLSAFEFFTDKAMKLVQKNYDNLRAPFLSSEAPYYALIEVESSLPNIKDSLEGLWMEFFEADIISDAFITSNSEEFKKVWSLRENITECIAIDSHVKKTTSLSQLTQSKALSKPETKMFSQS